MSSEITKILRITISPHRTTDSLARSNIDPEL